MSDWIEQPDEAELFENPADWEKEWVGMPEFVQKKQKEYAKIIVRFRCQEDLETFANLIGQKLNANSQCTWFPPFQSGANGKYKYVDESKVSGVRRVQGQMGDAPDKQGT